MFSAIMGMEDGKTGVQGRHMPRGGEGEKLNGRALLVLSEGREAFVPKWRCF